MSSKGTQRYTFRLAGGLIDAIEVQIAQRNLFTREEPWDLTAFVRIALVDKLEKMRRSRSSRRRKNKTAADA